MKKTATTLAALSLGGMVLFGCSSQQAPVMPSMYEDTTIVPESTTPATPSTVEEPITTTTSGSASGKTPELGSSFTQTPTASAAGIEDEVLSELQRADQALGASQDVLALARSMDKIAAKHGVRVEAGGSSEWSYKVTYTDQVRCYASEYVTTIRKDVLVPTTC